MTIRHQDETVELQPGTRTVMELLASAPPAAEADIAADAPLADLPVAE